MLDVDGTKAFRRPRFRRSDEAPSFQITKRDVEIVHLVARYRFLRSTHLSQLLDASHKKICERLTSLFHAGYLDRPRSQLEYHVRGAGSAPYVYALGNRGAQLLKQHGAETLGTDWTRKNQEATRQFLLHTLAIADMRVALTTACRNREGILLQEPEHLLEGLPETTRSGRNPWGWRSRVQHGGAVHDIGVLPDYVFALILPDGRRRPFVVEIDRGTMPVERSTLQQTSILRKFLCYQAAYRQGVHTARFGWRNFRVLVTSTKERVQNMQALVLRTPAIADSPLFLFADQAELVSGDFLTYPWSGAHDARHTLI